MSDRIETIILNSLFKNEDYTRKALPFLQPEYFSDKKEKLIFLAIKDFINQYNNLPTKEAIVIGINKNSKIKEEDYKGICNYLKELNAVESNNLDWLLDRTEEWCQDRAIYNAILGSIKILDNKDQKPQKGMIPKLLQDALAVGFKTDLGHDYKEDFEMRFDFYHKVEEKLPFDIELLNKITGGGLPSKSLNVFVAGTGGCKSLTMCHLAASYLSIGKNVLYITLEMSRERIAERIDANLLNINIQDLKNTPRDIFKGRVNKLRTTEGKLLICEFPTASSHVGHFRNLLNELNLKKNFKPDVLIVDYINLCNSFRIKASSNANSYTLVKSIAEELRGLAMEFNFPVVTATQSTRCISSDSLVCVAEKTKYINKRIDEVLLGDKLLSFNGVNEVTYIYPKMKQAVYRVKTESGKELLCSDKHRLICNENMEEKSIQTGLKVGDRIHVQQHREKERISKNYK